jgi:lipoprotein-releasing system ATP-binding protein
MILAENIHKSYGEVEVLKGVSLNIRKGEIVSVVGASGAGKTTLLQILGTLDTPSPYPACKIAIDGQNITLLGEKQLALFRNRHIGFIFQFHQLLPEFTAMENVCIPAFIRDTPRLEAEGRARELMEFLGLGHRLHHKPSELSGGEQQRVAVARALVNQPSVVLADEPSGNLDSTSADRLHRLFFELRERFGQTFVIVTHNEELAEIADRKLTMVDGRIVDENGDPGNS